MEVNVKKFAAMFDKIRARELVVRLWASFLEIGLAFVLAKRRFLSYRSAPFHATPSHEPLVNQSRRENIPGRGMVLASRFLRSGLRFSLSGLACVEIAPGEIRTQREVAYRHLSISECGAKSE